ncbi:uncharacterized protein HD556DRAFT_275496 [Suillus plorans]|uniref:Uncharacterized protein n=1 Tax=Suillus plorans TaxID=116603 RepID=A0A9P7IYQ7_9AGAM|nr:uncharacterized protein HD556DRAFT_275496 [Suillus plorans]KAG1797132.1 hypothetical protein HD556DRAFT_275496 [Suillus plorans]
MYSKVISSSKGGASTTAGGNSGLVKGLCLLFIVWSCLLVLRVQCTIGHNFIVQCSATMMKLRVTFIMRLVRGQSSCVQSRQTLETVTASFWSFKSWTIVSIHPLYPIAIYYSRLEQLAKKTGVLRRAKRLASFYSRGVMTQGSNLQLEGVPTHSVFILYGARIRSGIPS